MPLVPLALPPGIVRNGTEYGTRGRWYDASLVRFHAGTIQPVGGWYKVNTTALTGRPVGLFAWRPNASDVQRWLAIGTESNCYAYDGVNTTDITPSGFVPGLADATEGLGFGAGPYGEEDFGDARTPDGRTLDVATWTFDAFGENLVACCTSDGKLYEWALDTTLNLAQITNAPTSCIGCFTTAERMLVAIGNGGDVRSIAWSDTADNTTWTAAATNTAGDLPVPTSGRLVTGCRTRTGNLLFTDQSVVSMTYIGSPFYYSLEELGDNCGIIGPNAKVNLSNSTMWLSPNGFFIYDGYVKQLPCDVWDYFASDYNNTQRSKICMCSVGEFSEVWCFYPSSASTENDRYIIYNYAEGTWTIGTLSRTACIDGGPWQFPQFTDASGYWYEHENDWTNNGAERTSLVYLTSGPVELGMGERMVWLNQCLHDESASASRVTLTLLSRFAPEGTQYTAGPYTLDGSNGYTDIRAQGRQFSVKLIESTSGSWRIGPLRFDVREAGRR